MTKTTKIVYVTSDKQEFGSEAEAQAHEINSIEIPTGGIGDDGVGAWIVKNRDTILSILGAKRRTRSDKGKSRKVKEHKLSSTILETA